MSGTHKILSKPQNNKYISFKFLKLFNLHNLRYFSWCDNTEGLRGRVFPMRTTVDESTLRSPGLHYEFFALPSWDKAQAFQLH